MLSDFLDFLLNGIFGFLDGLLGIFPASPWEEIEEAVSGFGQSLQIVQDVLAWINWLMPLNIAATITSIWIVAVFAYIAIKVGFKYAHSLTGV